MKKYLVLSLLSFVYLTSNAQSYMVGNWTGKLHQDSTEFTPFSEYKFSMHIEMKGAKLVGTSTIIAGTNFGVLHFTGSISDSLFTFREDSINRENKSSLFQWCYKSGTAKVYQKGSKLCMKGPWTGYTKSGTIKSPCSPGTLYLEKEIGFISMKGNIVDSLSMQPIHAQIKIVNSLTGKETLAKQVPTGEFDLRLPGANDYEITVTSKGFLTRYEHVDLKKSVILNIHLTPIANGLRVPLKSVLFEQGTSVLIKSSYPELERLFVFMKDNPTVKIELQGHTSNEGSVVKNKELSMQRVMSIQNYLKSKGILTTRISLKAFGVENPLYSNDTEEHRKLNRRVDFVIVTK